LLFTTPDASAVLPMSAGGKGLSDQVIVNIYVQTAGTAGGIFLTVLLGMILSDSISISIFRLLNLVFLFAALCVFFAGQSSLLVASRIAFALSHDGLLPSDFTHIDPGSYITL
jgi:amino acid transporter